MTFINESEVDRAVRMLAGMLLLGTAWAVASGTTAAILFVLGGVALATGIVGWCPAYTVLGLSTRKSPAAHCPNCEPEHRH